MARDVRMLSRMPRSDRAFRALALEQPHAIVALLELCAPQLITPNSELRAEDVTDPGLIAPPALQADWAARVGDDQLLHVEGQGYRDDGFVDRLLRYHLGFFLRFPDRQVHSVALWLKRPRRKQRLDRIVRGGVSVPVTSLVLSELSAELLLSRRATTCFAAGADRGEWTDAELCRRVVAGLGEGSTERERVLAIVLGLMVGRYDAMIKAMKQAELEMPIIEDLVLFGEDRGRARGLAQGKAEGRAEGKAEAVLSILRARGLHISTAHEQRIAGCRDSGQLDEWIHRAVRAGSVDELFD